MSNTNNTILDDHRNMLSISKQISDFQEINLKNWAFIVFDNLKKCSIQFSFEQDNMFYAGTIKYNFVFEPDKVPSQENRDIAFNHLSNWVKSMFWTDTEIIFYKNGELWK